MGMPASPAVIADWVGPYDEVYDCTGAVGKGGTGAGVTGAVWRGGHGR